MVEVRERRHGRSPVVRRGIVVHEVSGATFRCTIVDISLGGARLQLIAPDLPDEGLTLIDTAEGRSHALRVVWRKGSMIGVAFVSTVDLPE